MYHGTNEVSKINIAQNGFKLANKVGGHTQDAINKDRFGADSELAEANSQHHHFAANKSVANVVAMTSSPGEEALVRLIGVANEMRLEPDPFMRTANGVRTNADVPSEFVLGSKHSPPRANGEVFRRALSRAGIDVDQDRAGQLLRTVQSDSEDDFRAESGSEDEFELSPLPAESNSNVNRGFRFGQGPESHGDAD
jgi:type III effector protein AvrRpm1